MKTIDIKGKPYIEVNQRIKYFREHYQDWALESEIVSLENGVCVIKATVRNPEGIIKATGYAYETENSTFINKTSYIENCETSAWGRALGNLGIGIDTSIASAEEVLNAQLNQNKPNKPKTVTKLFVENKGSVTIEDTDLDIITGLAGVADTKNLNIYYTQNKSKVKDLDAFIQACKNRKEAIING